MNQTIKTRIEQIGRGEVPEGYKKTKVGIVPCDWGESKLKDISTHVTRKNTDNSIHLTFTNSATQGVIKQTDYFDKEIANQDNTSGYYIVERNDYIYNPRISVSAPCGPINQSHFDEIGIVSPLYTVFKMKKGYEENRYFEFYFKSTHWYKYMHSVANYGARHDRMNITNDDLFGMPIPFPSIEELERIAEILGTQDKLIALKEKRIAEKKQQKKYLMQHLLTGKKRLPGFTGEWRKTRLGEIALMNSGGTPDSQVKEYYDGDYVWISISDMSSAGKYIVSSEKTLTKLGFDNCTAKLFPVGTVLFAMYASIGECVIAKKECCSSQAILGIEVSDKILNEYLYYFLLNGKSGFKKLSQASSQPNLNKQIVQSIQVQLPSIKEQKAIVNILSQADQEIELLQKDLEEEKNKKKALMQLLLTGIVRAV